MSRGRSAGLVLALVVGIAAAPPAAAQEDLAGGILYGATWACSVTAPEGWTMDQTSWADNGIYALFYERGQTLGPQIPVVYVNTLQLHEASDAELGVYVDWDRGRIAAVEGNQVEARDLGPDLGTHQGSPVLCYDYDYGGRQFETIAYLRFKDTCFLVVLASHQRAQRDENLDQLRAVVRSLRFLDRAP